MLTARVLIILQVLWICGIVPLAYGWSVDSYTENAEISPFTETITPDSESTMTIESTVTEYWTDEISSEISTVTDELTSVESSTFFLQPPQETNNPIATSPSLTTTDTSESTLFDSTTETIDESSSSTVIMEMTNESSASFPTDEFSTDEPTSPPTTIPPSCDCESMQIELGTVEVASNWFAVSFRSTTSSLDCIIRDLTALKVSLHGPFGKEDTDVQLQNCTALPTCLHPDNNSFLFNSTLCCRTSITVRQCSNYTLFMTPQYSPLCSTTDELVLQENTTILTLPGPSAYPTALNARKRGSDWVEIVWEDYADCKTTFTSYFMTFETKTLPADQVQVVQVPLNCTTNEEQLTVFDSKNCPELFIFGSCSVYQVTVAATIFDIYNSSTSSTENFNTEPPQDLILQIDNQVEAGSDWLAVGWNLSVPQCQSATNRFRLELKNIQNGSLEILNCTTNQDQSIDANQFLFNSSSNDCGSILLLSSCTDYALVITPQIYDNIYEDYQNKTNGRTIPGTDATALILSTASGSDWISFNWTSSVKECRRAITGFWLSILPTEEDLSENSFQFIGTEECYPNLEESQEFMFNTSSTCSSNWASPEILTCSNYQLYVFPQFFNIYNGSLNSTQVDSTAGTDITANITSVAAGKNWISFSWIASDLRCDKTITGLWVTMSSSAILPDGENRTEHLCPVDPAGDPFHIFNTSSSCFSDESLGPCRSSYFQIILDLNGDKLGLPNYVERMTTPGDDSIAIVNNGRAGVDWISFNWKSSVSECQKFISGYQLNVTSQHDSVSQLRDLPQTCSAKEPFFEVFFNSSLPCTDRLLISPCTNYSVSIIPKYLINNEIIYGLSVSLGIGSESGGGSEIEEPKVSVQNPDSITLNWRKSKCHISANFLYYNVSVQPDWNLGPKLINDNRETFLTIKPDCLIEEANGTVSVMIKEKTCNSRQGFKFESCSPYVINVLPVYQLESANQDVLGWTNQTQTAFSSPVEASVNDLVVESVGKRWISVVWPIPSCKIPITQWNLTDTLNQNVVILPPECPTFVNSSHYRINVTDSIVCRNFANQTAFSLIPCSSYQFRLTVKYRDLDEQTGERNDVNASTEIEPPGPVNGIKWNGTETNIFLQWNPPERNPQCVEDYLITWNEYKNVTNNTHILLDALSPCVRFPVSVQSRPVDYSEPSVSTLVSTASVDPAPIASDIGVRAIDELTRNVSWLKPDYDFCIAGYKVDIYQQGYTSKVFNQTIYGKDSTSLNLQIGDPFEQDELYTISVSSYSDFNGNDTSSEPKTHSFTWSLASGMINVNGVICGIIFFILTLVIIFVISVIRRRERAVLTPVLLLEEKITNVLEEPNMLKDQRPIHISKLATELSLLEADSGYQLSREFDDIKILSSGSSAGSSTVAELPVNRAKNRYTNILPYDHSRVKIKTGVGEPPFSDYINASYIRGFTDSQFYIATQGPKPSTIQEFWLMCYEQDVKLIMALTALEEKGRIKCAQYWPSRDLPDNSIDYCNVRVELIDEIIEQLFVVRDFIVSKIAKDSSVQSSKLIRQIHYTQWPDFGCPENPETLIQLVQVMRVSNSDPSNGQQIATPVVVHCSAGVGRTGTLIALDILMEQARRTKMVDVVRTVLKIRKDRVLMVQSEDQYRFLYKCIDTFVRDELKFNETDKRPSLQLPAYQPTETLNPLTLSEKNPQSIDV